MDPQPTVTSERDLPTPDSALFWRWAGKASRPVVGWVLIGAGALAILIGYFGLSDRVLVAEQLPYLISGGIGGMALVIIGGVFLATQDVRRVLDRLEHVEDELATLRTMVADLHGALLQRADATTSRDSFADADADSDSEHSTNGHNGNGNGNESAKPERVFALADGATFHRRDCQVLRGKEEVAALAPSTARRRGLDACRLCEPLAS